MTDDTWTIGTYDGIEPDEPYPGVQRRAFDARSATVTRYEFAPSATFPLHRHSQEQVTIVHSGMVTMRIGEAECTLEAGAYSVIRGGVEHGITAGPDGAQITAIVVPRRERAGAYEVVR